MTLEQFHQLDRDGYTFLTANEMQLPVERIANELAELLHSSSGHPSILAGSSGPAYGARNLLRLWPKAARIVRGPLAEAVHAILGESAGVVRGLYFDKPPGHSWALPWHRDYTIAVTEHRPSEQFAKPTIKAGVPHLEAPDSLLQTMLTIRVHLDAMTDANGPLRVVPGSHRTTSEETRDAVTLHCDAGDVLLIRPLVLHASGHSVAGTEEHRRIVHLECASQRALPDGLEWDRFEPIRPEEFTTESTEKNKRF